MKQIAVKYRLYPSSKQEIIINKTFGCARKVYNLMLGEKIKAYKTNKKSIYLTPAKYKDEYPYLKEVDSLSLANAQLNLNKAYTNFFRRIKNNTHKKGFPKYKNKHQKQTYTTNNQNGTIEIKENKIKLPKMKQIKIKKHRRINGIIKSATISRSATNKYYVSVLYEVKDDYIKHLPKMNKTVGIDLGVKENSLLTLSNEKKYKNPKYLKALSKNYKKEQKKLSKKFTNAKKNNLIIYNKKTKHYEGLGDLKNYKRQQLKVAKIHEKIQNKRDDYQHKLSLELVKNYDIICMENLSIQNMQKNHHLAQVISDSSWNLLKEKIKYKAKWYGKKVVTIAKNYPSTQICFSCKEKSKQLKQINGKTNLQIRFWSCENCGSKNDRDINASKNILFEGLQKLKRTVGNTGIACNISETADNIQFCIKSSMPSSHEAPTS
jgi:putative transposase